MEKQLQIAKALTSAFERIIFENAEQTFAKEIPRHQLQLEKEKLRKNNDAVCLRCYDALQSDAGLTAEESRELIKKSIKTLSGEMFVQGWSRKIISEDALDKSINK